MAKSTGPMLAIGGLTFVNGVLHDNVNVRPLIGAGFAAAALSLIERANETLAVGLAWTALVTVLLVRVDPKVPSPAESFLSYWNKGGK